MCRNRLNAEQTGEFVPESEGEHIVRRFSVEAFSANTVDVRENQIYCILRERIEAFSFRHDISEKSVIFLNKRLL